MSAKMRRHMAKRVAKNERRRELRIQKRLKIAAEAAKLQELNSRISELEKSTAEAIERANKEILAAFEARCEKKVHRIAPGSTSCHGCALDALHHRHLDLRRGIGIALKAAERGARSKRKAPAVRQVRGILEALVEDDAPSKPATILDDMLSALAAGAFVLYAKNR